MAVRALVTGAAGFIGSHADRPAARRRRARDRRGRVHRLLRRRAQAPEPRAARSRHRGFRAARAGPRSGGSRGAARGGRGVPPGGAGGRARFVGARLRDLRAPQRARHAAAARALPRRAARALRLRLVVVASTATPSASRPTRQCCRGRSRPTASPSSRASTWCCSTGATSGCRSRRCATSPCTARASAPTWRSIGSAARCCAGEPITVYGDGRQSRDFTYVADAIEANVRAWKRSAPQGVYNVGGGSQVEVLEAIAHARAARWASRRAATSSRGRRAIRCARAPTRRASQRGSRLHATRVGIDEGLAAEAEWARGRSTEAPAMSDAAAAFRSSFPPTTRPRACPSCTASWPRRSTASACRGRSCTWTTARATAPIA